MPKDAPKPAAFHRFEKLVKQVISTPKEKADTLGEEEKDHRERNYIRNVKVWNPHEDRTISGQ